MSESFRESDRRERGDRYRGDTRNDDWDSRSRTSARFYRADGDGGDGIDDSLSRPSSRNRYYRDREPDDYYNSRYRHHHRDPRYDDLRRQEELELQYRMQRDRIAESLMYNSARPNYNNAMDLRRHMEDLRLRNPPLYRDWYDKYLAHKRNPTHIPFPSLPGYSAMPSLDSSSSYGPAIPQDLRDFSSLSHDQRHPSISSGRQSASEMPYAAGGNDCNEVASILSNSSSNQGFQPIIDTTPARSTPMKFRNSHSFAIFTPQGQLMTVKGAAGTTIEICGVKQLIQHLPEVKELEHFPGPLVRGTTHKNTLIQFCQRKIQEISLHKREGDRENFILLWEVLVLLLRQNGNVVGSDISELLLETAKKHDVGGSGNSSRKVSRTDSDESDSTGETSQSENVEKKRDAPHAQSEKLSKEEVTQQFCKLLLFGHRKDALDYAMNNDLWGHALFLSSKLDERTHAHVLTRFSAVLPANHPLQTLYQMLSGRQPSSITNCIEDSFGDWRPHLAMILSNSGYRSEVESKAIVSLGDTLGFKNQLFAAQFCYLMAQMEFTENSKLGPLLGYTHHYKNVIEATQMTEIYEFAKRLADPNFSLGLSFFERKLNYMNTLIDYGFLLEAYSYCEEIATMLLSSNCDNIVHATFTNLIQIGERLKHFSEDPSLVTPQWIVALKEKVSWSTEDEAVVNQINGLAINQQEQNVPEFDVPENVVQQEVVTPNVNENTVSSWMYNNGGGFGGGQEAYTHQPVDLQGGYQNKTDWVDNGRRGSSEQLLNMNTYEVSPFAFSQPQASKISSQQPSYGNNNNIYQPQPTDYEPMGKYRTTSVGSDSANISDKVDNHNPMGMGHPYNPQPFQQPNANAANKGGLNAPAPKSKDAGKTLGKPNASDAQSSWLGGLFSKLPTLKPKNQMILPEDKDPAIKWNAAKQKWENTKEEEDESSAPAGPPPKDSDLHSPDDFTHPANPPRANSIPNQIIGNANVPLMNSPVNSPYVDSSFTGSGPNSNANGVNSMNKYKLQKGSRNNYVDVFNPGGQNQKSVTGGGRLGNGVMAVPNFFVPPSNVAAPDAGPVSFLTAPSESPLIPEDTMGEGNYATN